MGAKAPPLPEPPKVAALGLKPSAAQANVKFVEWRAWDRKWLGSVGKETLGVYVAKAQGHAGRARFEPLSSFSDARLERFAYVFSRASPESQRLITDSFDIVARLKHPLALASRSRAERSNNDTFMRDLDRAAHAEAVLSENTTMQMDSYSNQGRVEAELGVTTINSAGKEVKNYEVQYLSEMYQLAGDTSMWRSFSSPSSPTTRSLATGWYYLRCRPVGGSGWSQEKDVRLMADRTQGNSVKLPVVGSSPPVDSADPAPPVKAPPNKLPRDRPGTEEHPK